MDSESMAPSTVTAFLRDLMTARRIRRVVPIISNSYYLNEVLGNETNLIEQMAVNAWDTDQDLTIEELFTRLWSKQVQYPLSDSHNLARVAQYLQVLKLDRDFAKEDYLDFLKSQLLKINAEKQENVVRRLKANMGEYRLSEIVNQLGYARALQDQDPLDMLANVPFSNYITTSYHDFLERALIKANRTPITQYLRLDSQGRLSAPILDSKGKMLTSPILDNENNILVEIPNLQGSVQYPVVYHLYGFESDPESLVISEDDYIRFLITIITDLLTVVTNSDTLTNTQPRRLPMGLRTILSSSSLLLLGYQLQDWDFRVLFRIIMQLRTDDPKRGIFIQVPPKKEKNQLVDYLSKYFNPKLFDVEWKHPVEFTRELWKIWEEGQRTDD